MTIECQNKSKEAPGFWAAVEFARNDTTESPKRKRGSLVKFRVQSKHVSVQQQTSPWFSVPMRGLGRATLDDVSEIKREEICAGCGVWVTQGSTVSSCAAKVVTLVIQVT